MKKFLFASTAAIIFTTGSAGAADVAPRMHVKARPIAYYDWTGFYVGGYAGIGVNRSHGFDPTGSDDGALNFLGTGFTGGGTAGYNWQFGPNWFAGIEGDFGYLGLSHDVQQYNESFSTNSKTSWIGTVRGRLGYTNGPSLRYITGGVAWVNLEDTVSNLSGSASVSSSKTQTGYAFGSGVETMLGGNWTAKAEYLFVDVGDGDTVTNTVVSRTVQTDKHRYHLQRFGLNYLFGNKPQPPLAASNWSGFYAGIVGGSAVAQARVTDPTGSNAGEFGNNGSGYTVGGLLGYNWQFAPAWVAGIEGDFSWLGIDHGVDDYNDSLALYTLKTSWIGMLRGRVGYSTGPALLYVTGGGAWVSVDESWDFGSGPVSSTKTLSGYTVGGGIETMLAGNWTSRTEYLYVDVGDSNTLNDPSDTPVRANHQFHLFRSGLTYRFGDLGKGPVGKGPVVTRY